MKLSLNLEFDSIAEMQDWIIREAAQLATGLPPVDPKSDIDPTITREAADAVVKEAFEEAPPVKPKRKRRTKAEMAAARAAEKQAAATPEPEPEPAPEPEPVTAVGVELGTEPEPPAEVEAAAPAGGNGSGELAELQARFKVFLAKDPHAAVAELDRVVGPSGKFGECAVEVQREILAVLEGRQ